MTPKVILNSNQAKVIANAIYKDILSYVQTHQKEYEEFLKSEENKNFVNCNSKLKHFFKNIMFI